jgi:hypothetical protein
LVTRYLRVFAALGLRVTIARISCVSAWGFWLYDLRPSDESVVAGPVRERRSVIDGAVPPRKSAKGKVKE